MRFGIQYKELFDATVKYSVYSFEVEIGRLLKTVSVRLCLKKWARGEPMVEVTAALPVAQKCVRMNINPVGGVPFRVFMTGSGKAYAALAVSASDDVVEKLKVFKTLCNEFMASEVLKMASAGIDLRTMEDRAKELTQKGKTLMDQVRIAKVALREEV